jgi:ribosome-associated protein
LAILEVTPQITIDESELEFSFVHASGPGGQNVNKVASAVQLRFDVQNSPSLPEDVRKRLLSIAHNRIISNGILWIEARQHRTQEQNRQEAINRLIHWVRRAAEKPKVRKKTRPTLASQQRRLAEKRRRGEIKRLRKYERED